MCPDCSDYYYPHTTKEAEERDMWFFTQSPDSAYNAQKPPHSPSRIKPYSDNARVIQTLNERIAHNIFSKTIEDYICHLDPPAEELHNKQIAEEKHYRKGVKQAAINMFYGVTDTAEEMFSSPSDSDIMDHVIVTNPASLKKD